MVGGGVMGFTDEEARDLTDPGGSWEARVTVGTRTPVAIEGAYIGSAQNLEFPGLDEDALVVGNGAEATLRVNILPSFFVQPYVFGGLGWTYYSIEEADTAGDDSDNVFSLPYGAGVSFRVAQSLLRHAGARITVSAPADGTGPSTLAQARAQRVRDSLATKGVAATRVSLIESARAGSPVQLRLSMPTMSSQPVAARRSEGDRPRGGVQPVSTQRPSAPTWTEKKQP